MITYKNIATLGGIAAFVVFIVFGFIPVIANFIYGIEGNPQSNFILRRASFLLLGLGLMAWLTRNEPPSVSRNAIALGFGAGMLGIMCTGIYDWARGFAGDTIWIFTIIEAVFGSLFVYLSRDQTS